MGGYADPLPFARASGGGLGRTLRLADRLSNAVCALALALLALLLLARVAGYRPLVDYSNSMSPAINAGDVLIVRPAAASSVRRGEIVAFHDPQRNGKLITHRVVSVHASPKRLEFLTRGDANAAPESWSVARQSSVGEVMLRIPDLGRVTAWLTDALVRSAVLGLLAFALGIVFLRRIWRA